MDGGTECSCEVDGWNFVGMTDGWSGVGYLANKKDRYTSNECRQSVIGHASFQMFRYIEVSR